MKQNRLCFSAAEIKTLISSVEKNLLFCRTSVIYDMRIRPEIRKIILRKSNYIFIIIFLLKPCLWCKNTPGPMPPEGITSHSDNYCSYYVLNITSFLFPSDGIYLGG